MWWKTETGALYTVLIEDNEPELFGQFAHFLAVNVPGILHFCILKDVILLQLSEKCRIP
jgi:hypothetical protein